MVNKGDRIRQLASNYLKQKLFLLKHLPLGLFVGLKLLKVDSTNAVVSVPFKYLNKNPFRSIYFSVLSMAAELSTGVLAMAAVYDAKKPISMLLITMNAEFVKKAKTRVFFSCNNGENIVDTINKSIESKNGETIKLYSEGHDINNDLIAKFQFTWTFKPK